MLGNIQRIRRHVSGMDRDAFLRDEKTRDAVERCLERIAEAARKIGDHLDKSHPNVDLHKLRQFGSVLRHDYDLIEAEIIWRTVNNRLDRLEAMCEAEIARRREKP